MNNPGLRARAVTRLRSCHGSVLVEALIVSPVIVSIITGGAFLCYLAFAHFWIKLQIYEGLICLYERDSQFSCETRVRNTVGDALPFGNIDQLALKINSDHAYGEIQFTISDSIRVHKKTTLHKFSLKRATL